MCVCMCVCVCVCRGGERSLQGPDRLRLCMKEVRKTQNEEQLAGEEKLDGEAEKAGRICAA